MTFKLADPVLQVQDVSLTLGNNLILNGMNTTVYDIQRPNMQQGQVIGFLGPSGRGKTQFSKVLAGLQPPTTGRVILKSPPQDVKAGMVGYVTQDYLLRRNRTLLGNLKLAAKMNGLSSKQAIEKSMEYIELFELTASINKYPKQLSGGQRQRVAIAQQLLCSDHYLIMDEPFASLDLIMKEKVSDLILKVSLIHELNTIIVISHDIRATLKICDMVWLLGQDRDEQNNLVPGAYIKYTYNLAERGLCWDPNIFQTKQFNDLVFEVEDIFKKL